MNGSYGIYYGTKQTIFTTYQINTSLNSHRYVQNGRFSVYLSHVSVFRCVVLLLVGMESYKSIIYSLAVIFGVTEPHASNAWTSSEIVMEHDELLNSQIEDPLGSSCIYIFF
eukprot:918190_1